MSLCPLADVPFRGLPSLATDAQEWGRMNDALRRQVAELESQVAAMRMEVLAWHGPACGCPRAIAYQAYASQMMAAQQPGSVPMPMPVSMHVPGGAPGPVPMPMPIPMPVPVPG